MSEDYRWLFVEKVPLLYDKKHVAKQLKIETWLDLAQVLKELGVNRLEQPTKNPQQHLGYVI